MSLSLLTGPPNAGKTGRILDGFGQALDREPVLVVPTASDVERFEEELLVRQPVAIGGRIVTFGGLFELVGTAVGASSPPPLGAAQREALAAAVARSVPLGALAGAARRNGFARALADFIDELRAAGVPAAPLEAGLRRGGGGAESYARELVSLYGAYQERLAALGRDDGHDLARAAIEGLAGQPGAWGGRPVFLYGFDDLTPEQLRLVDALSGAAEVTVALVHEPGRVALAARARSVEQLERLGVDHSESLPRTAAAGTLAHLERSFLEDAFERRDPGDALQLLEAAGARAEVEQIAAKITRLLREGVAADAVVVIAREPALHAGLLEHVFAAYGIPAAVHASMPLGHTALGRAIIPLVRLAGRSGAPGDLVTFLRCSGRGSDRAVDRLEREVRVRRIDSAAEAIEAWEDGGRRRLWELGAIRQAAAHGPAALLDSVADLARNLLEYPVTRSAPRFEGGRRRDQLAAEAAARELAELAALAALDPALGPELASLPELLEGFELRRHVGPVRGRVEVLSPYRARARRWPHVFVMSLQDGEFPRRGREDPFLTVEQRRAAGLPERADRVAEERYLFHVALSRATRRLHLSFRTADDEGRAAAPSPFVADVLELLSETPDGAIVSRRGLSDTVFEPPADAPSETELARGLALAGHRAVPPEVGASGELAGRLGPRLERARARAGYLPGPLTHPAVLRELGVRRLIGASSLERFAECSYRYFVSHELRPRKLEPEADARAQGTAVHAVLEALYRERGRPTPETVDAAVARARELLAELVAGGGLAPEGAFQRAVFRRMESDVARFLRWDAEHPLGLEPVALEASFGDGEDDDRPPLALNGFALHGKIDRIDRGPDASGLVRDYKGGRKVSSRRQLTDEKKLQLPLYMLALRHLWGLDPLGGVYHPLGEQGGHAVRGLLRGPAEDSPLPAGLFKRTDFTDDADEFEAALAGARREAELLGAQMRSGHLDRDPLGGSCPRHCDFHPICRRERGQKNPTEEPQRPEATGNGD